MSTHMPLRPLPSLAVVLDALGGSTLRLVSDPAGRDLAVTQTVLHDPAGTVPPAQRGLLLGLGLRPAGDDLPAVLGAAAEGGYAGVAVKSWGEQVAGAALAADAAGVALLVVDDEVEWLHLDRMVGTALSGTRASPDAALSSLAIGDLFSLASAIATTTGGATAIEDLSRRVLAYSAVGGQVIDEERREGILGRQVPDLPLNDGQYAELYRTRGVVSYPATDTGLGRLAVAVRAGSEPLGSVWIVVPPEGLRPDAAATLASAAETAAIHLLRNRASDDAARQRRTDLVRRLLEHDDPVAARQLGLDRSEGLRVVAMQVAPGGTVDLGRLLDVVSLELEARLGPAGCVSSSGRLYALLSTDLPAERMRSAVEGAARAAGHALHTSLVCGISRAVRQAWRVSTSREEADRVLDLVLAGAAPGPVATAASLVDELHLLALADQHLDPEELSETAAQILAHDAQHGTQHAELVLTWLESQGDTRRVAERLGVHVNTVRYRLGRLQKTLGLDPSRPDQLLLVWLALRLRRKG